MEIWEQLKRQRVKHIVSSYQLDGEDAAFAFELDLLLQHYPTALVELALVETLVDNWLRLPLVRGREFLVQTHAQLQQWEDREVISTIAPEQFQQITGLDPNPVFGGASVASYAPVSSLGSSL